jgi:hypothetical protein
MRCCLVSPACFHLEKYATTKAGLLDCSSKTQGHLVVDNDASWAVLKIDHVECEESLLKVLKEKESGWYRICNSSTSMGIRRVAGSA